MLLTFRGDKAARAEEGTVLSQAKIMIARISLASSYRTQGIGLSSRVLRKLQSPVLHLHTSLGSFFHPALNSCLATSSNTAKQRKRVLLALRQAHSPLHACVPSSL